MGMVATENIINTSSTLPATKAFTLFILQNNINKPKKMLIAYTHIEKHY